MYVAATILCFVLAAVCLAAGAPKAALKGTASEKLQTEIGLSRGLIRFIGLAELAAVGGLLIGLFRWRPLGVAAAGGLVILFIGAVVVHARHGDFADAAQRKQGLVPVVLAVASVAALVLLSYSP